MNLWAKTYNISIQLTPAPNLRPHYYNEGVMEQFYSWMPYQLLYNGSGCISPLGGDSHASEEIEVQVESRMTPLQGWLFAPFL